MQQYSPFPPVAQTNWLQSALGYSTTVSGSLYGNGTYIARSSSHASESRGAYAAFDSRVPNGWQASEPGPAWIDIKLPRKVKLHSYALDMTDLEASEAPESWSLLASEDEGVTWPHLVSNVSSLHESDWVQLPRRVVAAVKPIGQGSIPLCNAYRLVIHNGASGGDDHPPVLSAQSTTAADGLVYSTYASTNTALAWKAFNRFVGSSYRKWYSADAAYNNIGVAKTNPTFRDGFNDSYTGQWIEFVLPFAVVPYSLELAGDMIKFRLYASSVAGSWDVLIDTIHNESTYQGIATYTIQSTKRYTSFVIRINSSTCVSGAGKCSVMWMVINGSRRVSIADLRLYGDPMESKGVDSIPTGMFSMRDLTSALVGTATGTASITGAPYKYNTDRWYDEAIKWNIVDLPTRADSRPLSMGFFRGKALHLCPIRVSQYPPGPLTSTPCLLEGYGTYKVSLSRYINQILYPPHSVFDRNEATMVVLSQAGDNLYNSSTGAYAQGTSRVACRELDGTPVVASGEWIQLRLPVSTQVIKYTIAVSPGSALPTKMVLLGSCDPDEDGSGWDIIDRFSQPPVVGSVKTCTLYVQPIPRLYRALCLVIEEVPNGVMEIVDIRFWGIEHAGVPDPGALAINGPNTVKLDYWATGARFVDWSPKQIQLSPGSKVRLLRLAGPKAVRTLILEHSSNNNTNQTVNLLTCPVEGEPVGVTWNLYAQNYDVWPELQSPDPVLLATVIRAMMFASPYLSRTDDVSRTAIQVTMEPGSIAGVVTDLERLWAFDTGPVVAYPGLSISTAVMPYPSTALTVSLWVKLKEFTNSASNATLVSLAQGSQTLLRLECIPNAQAQIECRLCTQYTTVWDSLATDLEKWTHFAFSFNPESRMLVLYRNGLYAGNAQCPSNIPTAAFDGMTVGRTTMGARVCLDNVRLYGECIPPRKVKELYDIEMSNPTL